MKSSSPIELSVIIPAYNEGKVVSRNLGIIDAYLATLNVTYEIIVVNDGSSDDTLEKATASPGKNMRTISYSKNQGKGYAINQGMMAAVGRYRLFMDMDLSTDLEEIPGFLLSVRDGRYDICVGNRNNIRWWFQKRPKHRALMGKVFSILSSVSSGYPLDDFTCGFKIFTADACVQIFPHQRIFNWAFDTELISIACQKGLRILQKPVAWHHHDNSKVRIGSAMTTALVDLAQIWYSKRRPI